MRDHDDDTARLSRLSGLASRDCVDLRAERNAVAHTQYVTAYVQCSRSELSCTVYQDFRRAGEMRIQGTTRGGDTVGIIICSRRQGNNRIVLSSVQQHRPRSCQPLVNDYASVA